MTSRQVPGPENAAAQAAPTVTSGTAAGPGAQPAEAAEAAQAPGMSEAPAAGETGAAGPHAAPAAAEAEGAEPDASGEADAGSAAAEPETAESDTPAAQEAAAVKAAAPGRPHKSVLAGAAVAGALLIAVPFLVTGEDGDNSRASAGTTPGSVLDDDTDGSGTSAIGSASPTPNAQPAKAGSAKKHTAGAKPDGDTGAEAGSDHKDSGNGGTPADGKAASGGNSASGGRSSSSGGSSSGKSGTSGSSGTSSGTKKSSKKSSSSGGAATTVVAVSVKGFASGRCIDDPSGGGAGTPLQIWNCDGSPQQQWRFLSDGTIRAMGLCMDAANAGTEDGTTVQVATCNGSTAQEFRLNSSYDLVNPVSDKCVDVREQGTGNGARLQLWDCNGQSNQKWARN